MINQEAYGANKKTILTDLKETQDKIDEKYSNFLKTILSLSVGFLGILVSLRSGEPNTFLQKIFFIVTIILLVIGILCSTILLFSEVHFLREKMNLVWNQLHELLQGKLYEPDIGSVAVPLLYRIAKRAGYTAFVLSLISVCFYSYFLLFE